MILLSPWPAAFFKVLCDGEITIHPWIDWEEKAKVGYISGLPYQMES